MEESRRMLEAGEVWMTKEYRLVAPVDLGEGEMVRLRFGRRDSMLQIDCFSTFSTVRCTLRFFHMYQIARYALCGGKQTQIQLPQIILPQQSSCLSYALGFSDFSSYSGVIFLRRRAQVQQASSIFVYQF